MEEKINWKENEVVPKMWKCIKMIIIISIAIFLILFPYILEKINIDFIRNADRLSYYGAIFGGFVTIIGIYITLKHNQRITSEERRKSVLPLITIYEITEMWQNSNVIFKNLNTIEKLQNDFRYFPKKWWDNINYKENIFQFYEDRIDYQNLISDYSKVLIVENVEKFLENKIQEHIYVPFSFCNSGIGTALNLKIQIGLANGDTVDKNKYILNTFEENLKVGEDCKISFYTWKCKYIPRECRVKLTYNDIYLNKYEQIHDVIFTDRPFFTLTTTINQNLIKKKSKVKHLAFLSIPYIGK
ncbi:hypothetical protein [Aminipila terrae]|uniref:Uncharacterized protein n=1 Tax=Aminipila terrae TaxID=2697030 RepID=A0A6P1MDF6_9FIRM|nr:hypothetical protein [Aminipila terrae]QHI72680.1 hypothetical protein Ami3637_09965 [Aminipila terrae]